MFISGNQCTTKRIGQGKDVQDISLKLKSF